MRNQALFLLIEDNEDDVVLIQRAFRQARLLNPLIVLKSADQAMQYFLGAGIYKARAEFPLPDLVLLDLRMPGTDGFDFLLWLRAQPGFGQTRVVVLTSSDLKDDVNRAYQLGANSFLIKPVDFERFVEISRALNGYWVWMDIPPEACRPNPSTLRPPSPKTLPPTADSAPG